MKCPICGQELKQGKKDPNYLLCYNCKKKFKVPQKSIERNEEDVDDEEEQRYSNIPPKNVRKKREEEMRRAYDEMLAVGDGKKKPKKTKRRQEIEDDYEDDYDDDYDYDDDEKMSKLPIIILGIAIVIVAALIVFVLLK